MKGDEVKAMQAIIGAEPQDGSFGPKTEEVLKAWQAKHDQHVDGIWGPGSEKHSKESCDHESNPPAESAKPENSSAPEYPGSPLKKGSKGEDVKLVQALTGSKQDGDFGPATERRVKEWQSTNTACCGSADGVVGPKTWKCMFG
jgi:peptidoglycan L-alanyl-D-glutamate endopeptidase CwlK